MKLFDLHCDTAIRLLSYSKSLYDNDLHISLKKASVFEGYAQVMAVFSQSHLSDSEAYTRFFGVVENLEKEALSNAARVQIIKSGKELPSVWNSGITPLIISVEDARILEGDLSRLDILYEKGVRLLTLNWSGETCIGGAHNTHSPLTEFGKSVVGRCFELGIIPDISHASFEGADDCISIAKEFGRPIVASHSNSYSVYPHSRNLRDENFKDIVSLGGIVGISLCNEHLNNPTVSSVEDIIRHIDHYLSLGGERTVCLGCDLDGTALPVGFTDISDLSRIEERMTELGYSDDIINNVTYKNAFDFMQSNL